MFNEFLSCQWVCYLVLRIRCVLEVALATAKSSRCHARSCLPETLPTSCLQSFRVACRGKRALCYVSSTLRSGCDLVVCKMGSSWGGRVPLTASCCPSAGTHTHTHDLKNLTEYHKTTLKGIRVRVITPQNILKSYPNDPLMMSQLFYVLYKGWIFYKLSCYSMPLGDRRLFFHCLAIVFRAMLLPQASRRPQPFLFFLVFHLLILFVASYVATACFWVATGTSSTFWQLVWSKQNKKVMNSWNSCLNLRFRPSKCVEMIRSVWYGGGSAQRELLKWRSRVSYEGSKVSWNAINIWSYASKNLEGSPGWLSLGPHTFTIVIRINGTITSITCALLNFRHLIPAQGLQERLLPGCATWHN